MTSDEARLASGWRRSSWTRNLLLAGGPVVGAVLASMLLLWLLGRDPIEFYRNVVQSGLLSTFGLQESINRAGPLLVISAGLVLAFKANIWHLGIDGCFLLGAVLAAGVGPLLYQHMFNPLLLIILGLLGAIAGALWSAPPAYLKAKYQVNEIVTTLIMTSTGVLFAQFLVKAVFQDPVSKAAAQTRVLPMDERLPRLFGTRIHLGVVIGLVVVLGAHYFITRTPVGMRLQIMGANIRAARHFGFNTDRLGYLSFYLGGALFGLAGALSIIGDWGVVGEGWNPAWGFLVVPLVFLARKNALSSIIFVAAFSVLSIGGELATRRAGLPNDFQLVILGLVLLFMTISEWLYAAHERNTAHLTKHRKQAGSEGEVGLGKDTSVTDTLVRDA